MKGRYLYHVTCPSIVESSPRVGQTPERARPSTPGEI
jgi:hypothetical protein